MMKKLIILIAFLPCFVSAQKASMADLIEALIIVESNGNSKAIGDNGKAYGILQIHSVMVQDANRISGRSFSHKDAFDPIKSKVIAAIILRHYKRHIERTKGICTLKDLARVWNGGGSAWKYQNASKEKNLENYWNKVLTQLK
jgi:soluble lytic murein transglycosylase-like protein